MLHVILGSVIDLVAMQRQVDYEDHELYLELGVSETEEHSECYITFYLLGVGDKCTRLHHKKMS